jgi:hypothetical protein
MLPLEVVYAFEPVPPPPSAAQQQHAGGEEDAADALEDDLAGSTSDRRGCPSAVLPASLSSDLSVSCSKESGSKAAPPGHHTTQRLPKRSLWALCKQG